MLSPQPIYNDFLPQLNLIPEGTLLKTLTFQVTDGCNLNCSYCYQTNKCNHIMDFSIAKKTIDYIFNTMNDPNSYFFIGTTGGIAIEFIGGEPLLAIDLIISITEYFEEKLLEHPDCPWLLHHCYNFSSNGTLYFDPKFQKYLEKYSNLISFSITIDGCKTLHDQCRKYKNGEGSYNDAIAAAIYHKNNYEGQGTKITLSPDNVNFVYEGIVNMINLGFNEININCAFEPGWNTTTAKILYEEMKKLSDWIYENNLNNIIYTTLFNNTDYRREERLSRKNWCGCAEAMYAVDYKGDLYPCIRFMESSLNGEAKPLILGNINNNFIPTAQEQENLNILYSVDKDQQIDDKNCKNCPIRSGCSWCSGYNYQHFNDINHKATYICIMHKARALGSKYYYLLHNDKKSYDQIKITKEMALEIISEEEWNNLQWKGE